MTTRAEAREQLGQTAKEVNVRLKKAEQFDQKAETVRKGADDHRLAAALKLAEARKFATENRIGWKRWVDANIERSYRDVKKLVSIGTSPDPKAALESARKRDRDAKARARRLGGGKAPTGAPATAQAGESGSPPSTTAVDPQVERVKVLLDLLKPNAVQAVMSYAIRHRLTDEQRRKLAKGLNAMVNGGRA